MIGTIGSMFIRSAWGRYALLALAVIAGLTAWGTRQRRIGRRKERIEREADIFKRTERGKNAYDQNRRENSGLGSGDIVDRLRGRDRDWRRLQGLR